MSLHANPSRVVILGAGPAGLTAAYELCRCGVPCTVVERDSVVGGLARTGEYKGYLFDLGGHRFFTKVAAVEKLWREVLGEDLLVRPRLSRIYYQGHFFQYPLEPWNVLRELGPLEVSRCGASFLYARLRPQKPEENFAVWVTNRFGSRLYEKFFKSYTEKVWGIPCEQIRAEWAAQRIRGLSFTSILKHAAGWKPRGGPRSLIKEFYYPRRGPGLMWSRMKERVESLGGEVLLETPVDRIYWEQGAVRAVRAGGRVFEGSHFLSTLAIRDLIGMLDPLPPQSLRGAALDFRYRDFLTVALMVRGTSLFPDNWIYVHDPNVAVGRIQNYTNWSPEMSPDPEVSCLGLEYFCSEGDFLWKLDDDELLAMGQRELATLGLVHPALVVDGTVVRVRKAYPVYDGNYGRGLKTVREFLPQVPNLQLVGRNGQHRYNNQDHSMLAAMLAARNILGGNYNLWDLNVDQDYQEEGFEISEAEIAALESSQPLVPPRL